MTDLFGDLPAFPPALPDDELRLLAALPERDEVQEIEQQDWATARRLQRRGLIKIHRWLDDPAGTFRTMYAERLPAAGIREIKQ
jgi:hypothetical protein